MRNTRLLKAWLRAGETVELRDRDRVIGRIVPARSPEQAPEWPDFGARLQETFGERVVPAVELVIKERGRY